MSVTTAAGALALLTAVIETRLQLKRLRLAETEEERQAVMAEIDARQAELQRQAMEELQRDIDDG